ALKAEQAESGDTFLLPGAKACRPAVQQVRAVELRQGGVDVAAGPARIERAGAARRLVAGAVRRIDGDAVEDDIDIQVEAGLSCRRGGRLDRRFRAVEVTQPRVGLVEIGGEEEVAALAGPGERRGADLAEAETPGARQMSRPGRDLPRQRTRNVVEGRAGSTNRPRNLRLPLHPYRRSN